MDGEGNAPGIPRLARQREKYMIAALTEYAEGTRTHLALRDLMAQLSHADVRNAVAYYANLPADGRATANAPGHTSAFDQGQKTAQACAGCHGPDGNSKIRGTPSLAGQQPHYLVVAFQRSHERRSSQGRADWILRDFEPLQLENLALYYGSQKPLKRSTPSPAASAVGENLTNLCGGCHGPRGVTTDAATPNLAGQDFDYLAKAIRTYRSSHGRWGMQRYVSGLADKEIEGVAAYYASQQPQPAGRVPGSTQELADKCDRCHDEGASNGLAIQTPKLRSQNKDYLVMALRAYRDGRRESSTMHNLSFAYSNTIIESLASWYASQPEK